MKKILMVAIVGASITISGCQAIKDNPGLGIGLGVAAGAVAATVAAKNKDDKDDNRDEYRHDRSRGHKRNNKTRNLPTCDFGYGNPTYTCVQGDGQIYYP